MKHIHSFESFVNESALNEATAVDKVQPIAKAFLDAVKADLKVEIKESQIVKMKPSGFEIRAVIDEKPIMYQYAKDYTEKHKGDLSGSPLIFKISPAISGRDTLWPADGKMYFDIDESVVNEGYMSELDIIRQESKTIDEFIKNAKKEFPQIAKMKEADVFLHDLWELGKQMK